MLGCFVRHILLGMLVVGVQRRLDFLGGILGNFQLPLALYSTWLHLVLICWLFFVYTDDLGRRIDVVALVAEADR